MKERKVCSRAGSVTLLRKRSRYAVVVITSSRVSFTERKRGADWVVTMWSFFVHFHARINAATKNKSQKAKMIVACNGTTFHYFRHSARLTRLHKKQIEESKTEMSGELFITMS